MDDKYQKGFLNLYGYRNAEPSNMATKDNLAIFQNVMSGTVSTPLFEYMLNFPYQRLSDIKSINMFNHSGLSIEIGEHREMEEIINEKTVSLPKANLKSKKLIDCLEKRSSVREYSNDAISIATLSNLLYFSVGISDRTIAFENKTINTRRYSSGGGLYPINIIVYIHKVETISDGYYLYQPYSHSLYMLKNTEDLSRVFSYNVVEVEKANVVFFFKTDLNRSYVKYGELALINILIEVGIIAQNIHLLTQNLSLGSCDIAGFDKKLIEKKLEIDGINSHILYSLSVGVK